MAIGFSSTYWKRSGQNRAGQRYNDPVTHLEVMGATHNPARIVLADINRAPIDGLAVFLRFGLNAQHPAHNDRTAHLGAVNRFFFKPDAHEMGGNEVSRGFGAEFNVFTQPRQWNACHLNLHPKLLGEANVSLNNVVHIGDSMAEHQGALQAHSECEPAVATLVDAAC